MFGSRHKRDICRSRTMNEILKNSLSLQRKPRMTHHPNHRLIPQVLQDWMKTLPPLLRQIPLNLKESRNEMNLRKMKKENRRRKKKNLNLRKARRKLKSLSQTTF